MIRMRNPWGNEAEWNGPWSDSSPEWRYIPEEQKAEIGLTFDRDGEFWMSFQDFLNHFDRVEVGLLRFLGEIFHDSFAMILFRFAICHRTH